MFEVSDGARVVLDTLQKNGYEAYLVGGCVRDFVLGRFFNDYDITTNATPEQVKSVFGAFKCLDTGIKHGTVTVIINNVPFEITTYRIDGKYNDNRHPEKVLFSSNLTDDLARRDFTVNAMAYNKSIVDPYNGLDDINNRMIRCVGKADVRFKEDGLRIIRALRFSSVLGFSIEKETAGAVLRNVDLLNNISVERIYAEFKKLICGKNVRYVFDNFGMVFDKYFGIKESKKRGKYIEKCPEDHSIRIASMFLHTDGTDLILKRLKVDTVTYNRVLLMKKLFCKGIEQNKVSVKNVLKEYGDQAFCDTVELIKSEGDNADALVSLYGAIKTNNECYCIKHLDVNGDDILALGYKNREVGKVLNMLLDMVIQEKVNNVKNELLNCLKD